MRGARRFGERPEHLTAVSAGRMLLVEEAVDSYTRGGHP